jgi:nucleoside phosphorylase
MDLSDSFDVVVICALPDPELAKLRQVGQEDWCEHHADNTDPTTYYRTCWTTKNGNKIYVIAASPNHMGLSSSASLATKMIIKFNPKLIGIVGIAAGIKRESVGFGDILATSQTVDYGSGKIEETDGTVNFRPSQSPIPIKAKLQQRLLSWDKKSLNEIRENWPAKKPINALNMHIGPLASGAAVINSRGPVTEILQHWRKTVGLEMEAYGVHRAASDTRTPDPMFLCMKSVADFAQDKSDDWQDYAAYTAANCFHCFLVDEWERLFPDLTNP